MHICEHVCLHVYKYIYIDISHCRHLCLFTSKCSANIHIDNPMRMPVHASTAGSYPMSTRDISICIELYMYNTIVMKETMTA